MGYVLLLGGARSGKSSRAVQAAVESGMPVTFIATAEALDAEMASRIEQHRSARPAEWAMLEEPMDVVGAISRTPAGGFVVVDCLTLWVSNLLGAGRESSEVVSLAERAAELLAEREGVVVSNEVGLGVVPANELARAFRDVLGSVNAVFARCASRSLFIVAGRALELT